MSLVDRYRAALERIAESTELVGLGNLDEPQFQPPGAAQRELQARVRIAREVLDMPTLGVVAPDPGPLTFDEGQAGG